MKSQERREFLANVGKGMLAAAIGPALAHELGMMPTLAAEQSERLQFGDREPLVGLFQDTPADKMLAIAVDRLKNGVKLEELVAAAAPANARTFCGLDYDELKLPERPVFDLLLRYACSEDGSLHAEKYYRTACEEFATIRPAFRWRQLVALARVTASEYGHPAPGYEESVRLLNL